jgi:hypothetical protein
MRPGFGEGVSIPSQRRWVGYVERWARACNKQYMERRLRIRSIHVWGLREGVRVAVQGYVDEGKVIKTFHTFTKKERREMDMHPDAGTADVVLEPKLPLLLPTCDVNVDFERRSNPQYGFAMITSIAHVWFNAFFEGARENDSGVFEIDWKAMDGIKGTSRKGMQALDRLQVVWSVDHADERTVVEPEMGEEVKGTGKVEEPPGGGERDLGLQPVRTPSVGSSGSGGSKLVGEESPVDRAGKIVNGTLPHEEQEEGEEPYTLKQSKVGSIKRGLQDNTAIL